MQKAPRRPVFSPRRPVTHTLPCRRPAVKGLPKPTSNRPRKDPKRTSRIRQNPPPGPGNNRGGAASRLTRLDVSTSPNRSTTCKISRKPVDKTYNPAGNRVRKPLEDDDFQGVIPIHYSTRRTPLLFLAHPLFWRATPPWNHLTREPSGKCRNTKNTGPP